MSLILLPCDCCLLHLPLISYAVCCTCPLFIMLSAARVPYLLSCLLHFLISFAVCCNYPFSYAVCCMRFCLLHLSLIVYAVWCTCPLFVMLSAVCCTYLFRHFCPIFFYLFAAPIPYWFYLSTALIPSDLSVCCTCPIVFVCCTYPFCSVFLLRLSSIDSACLLHLSLQTCQSAAPVSYYFCLSAALISYCFCLSAAPVSY